MGKAWRQSWPRVVGSTALRVAGIKCCRTPLASCTDGRWSVPEIGSAHPPAFNSLPLRLRSSQSKDLQLLVASHKHEAVGDDRNQVGVTAPIRPSTCCRFK